MTATDGADAASGPPVLTVAAGRATIRLNRPRQHNRLEPGDIVALMNMLEEIEAAADVRVLVLTGSGKSFSAGYHIGAISGRGSADRQSEPSFEHLTDRVENFRVPTVCALNGSVYGGATDLALACDFRIGVEGSQMFMPAARLGLHYYKGGLRRYVTRLGLAAAKKLFLTAATIDAEEMLRIGYLDQVVPAAGLAAAVDVLVQQLSAVAPLAARGMKRALNEIARNELDVAAMERAMQAAARSEDLKEGLAAWAEKRQPKFQGR
ncbi:MAG TPA: enoyl-CoA hydratase/isomerase family protein [Candidatus Sulfotelmatobacter sp.]|nr:enoyl-CoA hydratase/isomerase family protein [Candidatus Sulfotelmatobacter sp.]